ncbi:MAG: hypothetical protein MJ252_21495, partial [archaeon]|nr:hypothetical protein [archaeon]
MRKKEFPPGYKIINKGESGDKMYMIEEGAVSCRGGMNEIRKLGLEIVNVADGEIKALGDVKDIPRLNFNLRTAERVMIEVA